MAHSDTQPVMMGDKIIGVIEIDLETGRFRGRFDLPLVEMINEHFEDGVMSVSLAGKAGRPESRTELRKKLDAYLETRPRL